MSSVGPLTLRKETFESTPLPVSTGWLLADCMEFRGKQDLYVRRKPELLRTLREQAIIQSVESSNRIEGVTVDADRLRPLVLGKARPKDRPEEELAGYRRALDWIFTRKSPVRVDSRTIAHLHALCQDGGGDAGAFKIKDNEIIEFSATGERKVRFRPTSARQTPGAVDLLCDTYEQLTDSSVAPPLLLIATMAFDFLCIHPFRDGNGRVSRLLTTLLLQQRGFEVARYVSLERMIEQTKEDYYDVLKRCSRGWAEGRNEIVPWWNYFLTVLRRAYAEFADSLTTAEARPAKSEFVGAAILKTVGPFTLADLLAALPGVSPPLIKKVLYKLKAEKRVTLTGRGRGATWRVGR